MADWTYKTALVSIIVFFFFLLDKLYFTWAFEWRGALFIDSGHTFDYVCTSGTVILSLDTTFAFCIQFWGMKIQFF